MSKATLSTFDGSVDLTFLVAPSKTSETHKADYSKLSVLNTRQPFVRWKSSESTITFPDLKVITPRNDKDLSSYLNTLREWTKPNITNRVPPLLKWQWGTYTYPRVYLESAQITVDDRSPEGVPLAATVTLELLIAPIPPKPEVDTTKVKLSKAEQTKLTKEVQDKVKGDKNSPIYKKVGGVTGAMQLSVSEDGKVIYKGGSLGTIKDVLGKLPPGLNGLL